MAHELTPTSKRHRGFACLSPERRREIAAKGGANTPNAARSFSKDRELAVTAGRKGGQVSRPGGRKPPSAA